MSDRAGQYDTNCILCCAGPESSFTAKHCLRLDKHRAWPLHSGEKATRSGLDSVAYTKYLNKLQSMSSRTAPGEYPARRFIKCLQTDAFQEGSFKEKFKLLPFLLNG